MSDCPNCGLHFVTAIYRKVLIIPGEGLGTWLPDGTYREFLECGHTYMKEKGRTVYVSWKRKCQPCADAYNAQQSAAIKVKPHG